MMQLAIRTDRLSIRSFERSHLTDGYVAWLNDAEVVRYSEQRHRRHSLESCEAYYRSFAGTAHLFLAIETAAMPIRHIGNITVHMDTANGLADIAILIGARSCWGQGFGKEAWSAVMRELLTRPEIRKVTGGTVEPNQAMVGIMRGSGMQDDGRRRAHFIVNGAAVDVVHFAAFASEQVGRPRASQSVGIER